MEDLQRFVEWTKFKIKLHKSKKLIYFREREIWWISFGINIGYEEDGKHDSFERPGLIIKKFNKDMLWVVPLTTKSKTGKYYYQFEYEGKKYSVILSQLRLVSDKRLLRKIRKLEIDHFAEINKQIKKFL